MSLQVKYSQVLALAQELNLKEINVAEEEGVLRRRFEIFRDSKHPV